MDYVHHEGFNRRVKVRRFTRTGSNAPNENSNSPLLVEIALSTYQSDLLILRPSLHDGRIVHAVDDHGVDPRLPERVLLLQVLRDLLGGSRRREGAGQTEQDDGLVLGEVRQIVLVGRKAHVKFDGRQLVADGCKAARQRRSSAGCQETGALEHHRPVAVVAVLLFMDDDEASYWLVR